MAAPERSRKRRRPKTVRSEAYGRGSIYQDGEGRWYYQPPPFEKRRLPRVRCNDEESAKLAQGNHLKLLRAKTDLSNEMTVEAWFNFWFDEHVRLDLKAKTVEWYQFIITTYILPAIGHMMLRSVTGDHLIRLQNQLRKPPDDRKPLGNRTVRRVHAMLNRAFKKAVASNKIERNPMDSVEPPRVPRSKQQSLTKAQLEKFREVIEGDRLELLYDLMCLQGLRRGEVLGLLVMEYDRGRGVIKVSGQIQTINGHTARSSSPKSENSERDLPLTPRQREMADRHLERISEERRRLGVEWKEHGLFFPSERGTPIIPRNLNRDWYDKLVEADIVASISPPEKGKGVSGPKRTKRIPTGKKIPLHRLRHTAASRLNTIKATPRVIQGILGHGPGTVSEGYIHPEPWEMLEALLESEQVMLRRAA